MNYKFAITKSYPFLKKDIANSLELTNNYLNSVPDLFNLSSNNFFSIINQRNLSGLIGEIFKHSLTKSSQTLINNPHPDGRPDILFNRTSEEKNYYKNCFINNNPKRKEFAPYKFGGIEIKASIGSAKNAQKFLIGQQRIKQVHNINYWAHHRHECNLLAIFYDFCELNNGGPQIKAIFYLKILEDDWNQVSIGKPGSKKTSNTSLKSKCLKNLKKCMIVGSNELIYQENFKRLGFSFVEES
tara:strand:- start:1263 stop:1988 length:726 start_codon:yes stop_codon:yes gene_type:complete